MIRVSELNWYGAHQAIQLLHDQKKEVLVTIDPGTYLPRIVNHHWKEVQERVYKLEPDLELDSVGNWTMPNGKWNPTTFVSVKHLSTLPRSFLKNKVIVQPDEVNNKNLYLYLTPNVYSGETSEVKFVIYGPDYIEEYLRGDQVVDRCPPGASFMMSIASWPLKYVPYNYLHWFLYDQRISRQENTTLWVKQEFYEANKHIGKTPKLVVKDNYILLSPRAFVNPHNNRGEGWVVDYKFFRSIPEDQIKKNFKANEKTLQAYGKLKEKIELWLDQAYWQDEEYKREIDPEYEFNDFYGRGYWTNKSVPNPYSDNPNDRIQEFIGSGTTFKDKWNGSGLNKLQTKQETEDDDPTPKDWQLGLGDTLFDSWTFHGRVNQKEVKEYPPKVYNRQQSYQQCLAYLSWSERVNSLYKRVNDKARQLNRKDLQEELDDRNEELDRLSIARHNLETNLVYRLNPEDQKLLNELRTSLNLTEDILMGKKKSLPIKKLKMSTYLEKRKKLPDDLVCKVLAEYGLTFLRQSGVNKKKFQDDPIKQKIYIKQTLREDQEKYQCSRERSLTFNMS